MTEAEWLASDDPVSILDHLRGRASDRKLRLLAVACCRRFWRMMGERNGPRVVEIAEAFADGEVELAQLLRARARLPSSGIVSTAPTAANVLFNTLHETAALAADGTLRAITSFRFVFASEGLRDSPDYQAASELKAERAGLLLLLRDIFGNPFRPVAFDPDWRTPTVTALARGMYESRDFSPMPILADALQDAGCEDAAILNHCRGPGPHVRGCWVVDLVLGKA